MFLEKGVLKICSKFIGEYLCQSVIVLKLLCTFIEIAIQHERSPVNLLLIFRTTFPRETIGGLVLPFFRNCQNDMNKPFHTTSLFLYPLKTSENQRFSNVFRGYRKRRWYGMGETTRMLKLFVLLKIFWLIKR